MTTRSTTPINPTQGRRPGTPANDSRAARDDRGFTLVELTVAIAVFVVVMTIALGEMTAGISRTRNVDTATNTASTTRIAVEALVREIRQASNGGDSLVAAVESMSATSITFNTPDKVTPKHLRKVAYQLVAGRLQRSESISTNTGSGPWVFPAAAPAWKDVVLNITNTDIFTYWTSGSPRAPATTPGAVSSVSFHLDVRSSLSGTVDSIYRTGIDLRIQR